MTSAQDNPLSAFAAPLPNPPAPVPEAASEPAPAHDPAPEPAAPSFTFEMPDTGHKVTIKAAPKVSIKDLPTDPHTDEDALSWFSVWRQMVQASYDIPALVLRRIKEHAQGPAEASRMAGQYLAQEAKCAFTHVPMSERDDANPNMQPAYHPNTQVWMLGLIKRMWPEDVTREVFVSACGLIAKHNDVGAAVPPSTSPPAPMQPDAAGVKMSPFNQPLVNVGQTHGLATQQPRIVDNRGGIQSNGVIPGHSTATTEQPSNSGGWRWDHQRGCMVNVVTGEAMPGV